MVVFPCEPPITTRVLFLDCSYKNSGYEYIFKPNSCAFSNSGLSALACIPKIIDSISEVILSGNQPNSIGNNPFLSNRDLEGSKMASSLPVTWYPLLCKANAKLCIAAPPMAIKCVLICYEFSCLSVQKYLRNFQTIFQIVLLIFLLFQHLYFYIRKNYIISERFFWTFQVDRLSNNWLRLWFFC